MSKVRQLSEQTERVETGPVQFGDDWPGIFIRGDNAAHYALMLSREDGTMRELAVNELRRLFSRARV
ncbi:MAG: hypothetical protein ABF290_17120 [Thiogranum sp.]